jgi:hypothetical protein
MKAKVIFIEKNPITKNQNKTSFSSCTNIQFTTWEHFLQFTACKSVEIDAIGIKKLSGCPTKGYFTAKNAF